MSFDPSPDQVVRFDSGPDPLARLPALAARLGVAPLKGGDPATVILTTHAGESYDLFTLVGAFLDRIERHADEMSALADRIEQK